MRAIYLIARREYLSYVATWGFWLSLLSVPLIMGAFAGIMILAENSQPTRYFTIVDETGLGLTERVDRELNEGVQEQAITFLRLVAEQMNATDRLPAAEAAIRAEPGAEGVPEAVAALGVPVSIPEGQFRQNFIRVDAPAGDIEGLRPYLLGERTLSIDGDDVQLFAAIILRPGGDYGVDAEYWSTNRTSQGLKTGVRNALRDFLRGEALAEAGISQTVLDEINAINPEVQENSPERGRATAEVGIADRIPFIVGIVFSIGLWMVIFSVTNMLLTAMIEEKGNKILETLLATARYHEILVGKLLGLAAVSATLMLAWGGLGSGGIVGLQALAVATDVPIAEIAAAVFDPGLLIPAIGYFIVGYVMFGTVYLAIGSLCDTLQEAQSLMSPMILIMMVPFVIIMSTMENPDSQFLQWASWVPLWTPFLMMARLQTDPSLFEIIGTSVVMLVTAMVIISAASYIFRQGSLGRANASSIRKLLRFGRVADPVNKGSGQ
ncbi:ABC transporter permease [Hyphobacterium sp. HN65]|uniref:ABC transporter permease n=1 Tax=Hyphobacterium lacteum TaxID=3116575 RepID=A0ABU7LNX0_9PROT|nr:ABC transporter permease [Hyphobacterium sp. HN65]MEE2525618.1 ABC transporter permease [Hyphobacterium sp. HN65]